ncbi:hypothetical protein [Jeotgalibacillus sp. R-1-5s-1]|uniref:hypothetical protein n=1 Tax=Jeotgalibacillus sp. R-1-5s-1 TaxID=2555897 RepID=UPI00141B0999|nr:hypothetical protein [Jeotgalibacillus sp. R-1-5s-1]
MGVKKDLLIFALKYGGQLLEEFLDFLGKKSYADAVQENRLAIAKYLERVEDGVKRDIKNFLIDDCDMSPTTADVVAEAILFFAF